MNLLLDTHVALWAIADSLKLPQKARNLIQSTRTTIWISSASVWEIAIKRALGRGDMPISSRDAVRYFRVLALAFHSTYCRLPPWHRLPRWQPIALPFSLRRQPSN